MPHLAMNTPFGPLTVFEESGAIVAIEWGGAPHPAGSPLLEAAAEQLNAYFDGRLEIFELPLRLAGTPFAIAVWRRLGAIPYGRTRTYGELARELGTAARAVGGACGRNPIPIVIPCHRAVGAGGRLGGYSGGAGIDTKRALLALEGVGLD